MENRYIDLVYHGYEWEPESYSNQEEFRELLKKNFPEVKIEDAYDCIKGYRTAVYADEKFDINIYHAFLLAHGLSNCSFNFLTTKKEDLPSEEELIKILRERWPESLKEEYR